MNLIWPAARTRLACLSMLANCLLRYNRRDAAFQFGRRRLLEAHEATCLEPPASPSNRHPLRIYRRTQRHLSSMSSAETASASASTKHGFAFDPMRPHIIAYSSNALEPRTCTMAEAQRLAPIMSWNDFVHLHNRKTVERSSLTTHRSGILLVASRAIASARIGEPGAPAPLPYSRLNELIDRNQFLCGEEACVGFFLILRATGESICHDLHVMVWDAGKKIARRGPLTNPQEIAGQPVSQMSSNWARDLNTGSI